MTTVKSMKVIALVLVVAALGYFAPVQEPSNPYENRYNHETNQVNTKDKPGEYFDVM